MKPKSNPFVRHTLALATSSAFLCMGTAQAARQTKAATLVTPGAVQVKYTFGEGRLGMLAQLLHRRA